MANFGGGTSNGRIFQFLAFFFYSEALNVEEFLLIVVKLYIYTKINLWDSIERVRLKAESQNVQKKSLQTGTTSRKE